MSGDDELHPMEPEVGVNLFLKHREPSVRETTMRNARTRLRYFLKWCDDREITNLNDLTGRKMADFVAWRREDIKPITLQKQLSTIRVALRFWADIEAVPEGLAEKVHAPELPDGAESKDVHLDQDEAEEILAYLDRYHYASREHAMMALIWRTGLRTGSVHALDLDDLKPEDHAILVEHRPETDTSLKNGDSGTRWVYLGPQWFQILEEYVSTNRIDAVDEHGREPLFSTQEGRAAKSTIQKIVYKATWPCRRKECPHNREPDSCPAVGASGVASKCPSNLSPHAIRRGAITTHLNEDIPPETVSERMNVSLGVLYQHYDARTAREKMEVRKQHLKGI